ncbi:hypothetical protein QW180_26755 [Vibrio sinaloensis]|nr:hypothetical protein [Vibrio sinaloensis]
MAPPLENQRSVPEFLRHATLPIFYVSSIFEASDELGLRLESDAANVTAITLALEKQSNWCCPL